MFIEFETLWNILLMHNPPPPPPSLQPRCPQMPSLLIHAFVIIHAKNLFFTCGL